MVAPSTLPPWTARIEPAAVAEGSAFQRLWRGFMTARVSLALMLTALFGALLSLGPVHGSSAWLLGLCVAYLGAALAVRAFSMPTEPGQAFDPQWVTSIGIDLVAFSTLQFLQAGGLNYAPLFALPVLMAAVLGSALLAMGTAAGVTLLLLVDAWVVTLDQSADLAPRFLQAGLTGIGYFVVALLANQLAARLAREERVARRSQRLARMQAQVNEMVIETLGDGVLVVGVDGTVQVANPSARQMLGAGAADELRLFDQPGWRTLGELAQLTIAESRPRGAEIALAQPGGERRLVHARAQPTPPHDTHAEPLCVVFLQDLRELEARLRTEKLAAMGRMSAAVAHEIRNPLAAIAQANDLLGEELSEPSQRQLSELVRHNAQRLSRIVEDILDIVRVQQQGIAPPLACELDAEVARVCQEWSAPAHAQGRLQVVAAARGARVVFEPEHLRRVLVNLLDNALRYAGQAPDSIRVSTDAGARGVALRVWSDGAPLEQGVQRHLFEPFFSSESRSSGLGLYICRELCERHGAAIGYRRAPAFTGGREGNEFFVSFRTPAAATAARAFGTIGA